MIEEVVVEPVEMLGAERSERYGPEAWADVVVDHPLVSLPGSEPELQLALRKPNFCHECPERNRPSFGGCLDVAFVDDGLGDCFSVVA